MIYSFGFDKGSAPSRAGKVFDIRDLTHATSAPEFDATKTAILDYVRAHADQDIAIGCQKGLHRSVVMANAVATAARTSVYHRDKK